jgi:hypothetical protein
VTPTPDQLTDQLAAHLWGFDFDPPDVHRIAAYLAPVVHGLLADARTDGFRHGYTAGRTLTREHLS